MCVCKFIYVHVNRREVKNVMEWPHSIHIVSLVSSRAGGIAAERGFFGPGSGDILTTDVACNGSEFSIAYCPNNTIVPPTCNHDTDAAVLCQPGIGKEISLLYFTPLTWIIFVTIVKAKNAVLMVKYCNKC